MPVQIVNSPTNPKAGLLNKNDLKNMIKDHMDNIQLIRTNPGPQALKTYSLFFYKKEIELLLEQAASDGGGIRIRFIVYPDLGNYENCEKQEYKDHLAAVVFATDKNKNDINKLKSYILIPGFRSAIPDFDGNCCGTMNPPGS